MKKCSNCEKYKPGHAVTVTQHGRCYKCGKEVNKVGEEKNEAVYLLLENGMQIIGEIVHQDDDLVVLACPFKMFAGQAMPLAEVILPDNTEYPFSRDIILYSETSDRIEELYETINTNFKAAKSGIQMAKASNNLHQLKPGNA